MNKQKLYENIMKNVSLLIKKALNENNLSDIDFLKSELKKLPFTLTDIDIDGHMGDYTVSLISDDIDFDDPDEFLSFSAKCGDYETEFDIDLEEFLTTPYQSFDEIIEDRLREAVDDDWTSFAIHGEPFWPEDEDDDY